MLVIGLQSTNMLSAQVLYVDGVNGNDGNTGLAPNNAFQTINWALQIAQDGFTINVLPDTYQETLVINQNIRLEALPTATLQHPPGVSGPLIEIFPVNQGLDASTLVRGFTLDGSTQFGDTGIYIHNGTGFVGEVSPTIEGNNVFDCDIGIHLEVAGSGNFSTSLIRYNTIQVAAPVCGSAPLLFGIFLEAEDLGTINNQVRSNCIFRHEFGYYVDDHSTGSIINRSISNVLAYNEWGYFIFNTPVVSIENATVAFASTASNVSFAYGIENYSPFTTIDNSIFWIPDSVNCSGNPVTGVDINDFGSLTLDTFSIVEDQNPGLNPAFVNPGANNFRLLASSPAIDTGNTALVLPTGTQPIDYDKDGGPRIVDAFRTATNLVDLGAYEFTPVSLDITSGYPGLSPIGLPLVNAQTESSFTFTASSLYPNDVFLWWYGLQGISNMNFVWPFWGNQLVNWNLFSPTVSPSLSVTLPTIGFSYLNETEVLIQCIFVDPNNISLGTFTRHILVELNL